jgi:hypothetical protein
MRKRMTSTKKNVTTPRTRTEYILAELAAIAAMLPAEQADVLYEARGWIAWAIRENRRLVRERNKPAGVVV